MRNWTTRIACVLFAFAPVAYADQATKEKQAIAINASDIKWTAAPPDLPKGAQVTVLRGDPTKTGDYTLRLKLPDGYKIPPHWHSRDEQLTILSGTFTLHMGDSMESASHALAPGGYHFLPAKTHHAAQAKGETIVQIDGPGPFDIHYVNAADNPNPKSARR
jgi:quercetin dioxygenase-like cupin family protein